MMTLYATCPCGRDLLVEVGPDVWDDTTEVCGGCGCTLAIGLSVDVRVLGREAQP